MTTLVFGLLASTLLAADPKIGQPTVVAKGDGFVVHALGGATPQGLVFAPRPATATHLLHTALPGGKLTVLYRSGTTAGFPIPMGINLTPYTQTRVVGAVADAERLYALVWSTKWTVTDFGGVAGEDVKPPPSDTYTVRVFWLADGSEVGSYAIGGDKRPIAAPAESTEAGPLAVEKAGGVSVYGEAFRFKGKDRMK